jgi:hypothetical protein
MCFAYTNQIPKNVDELDKFSHDAFLQSDFFLSLKLDFLESSFLKNFFLSLNFLSLLNEALGLFLPLKFFFVHFVRFKIWIN